MVNHESLLWKRLRKIFGDRWWAVRVESHMTAGIPDVFFSIDGVSGWIELKSIKEYGHSIPTLTEDQIAWLHHGNAWMILEVRSSKAIYLIPGFLVVDKRSNISLIDAQTHDYRVYEITEVPINHVIERLS